MNLGDLFGVGWNKNEYMYMYIHSRTTTKSVPLLQPELGFANRMDQNMARYWYPNEKMVVVPVCLNGRRCYSACMGIVSY